MAKRTKRETAALEIRNFYGMSQKALATHLEISRAMLSMEELGLRTILGEPNLKMIRLITAITKDAAAESHAVFADKDATQRDKVTRKARKKLFKKDKALSMAEQALSKLKADHRRASDIIRSIEILRQNGFESDAALANILELGAEQLFEKTGEDAQFDLEVRIEGLKAEREYLKKRFKDGL